MALLTSDEQKRIGDAVSAAESGTSGEIVVAVIPESDDYAFRELVFGVTAGIAAFIVMILSEQALGRLLERIFWTDSQTLMPAVTGTIALLTGALFYFLAQIPFVDRLVAGRRTMKDAVRNRALRHFVERGVCDTSGRTGVLLFVSVLERRAELIADRGVPVSPDTWDRILSAMLRDISADLSSSVVSALEQIGTVLNEHLPIAEDDENEITDQPEELGKGS